MWALVLSLMAHALFAGVVPWLFAARLFLMETQPPETVISSTAVRIETRPMPRPRTRPARAARPRPAAPVQPTKAQTPPRPQPRPAPRELARTAPTAPPQPSTPPVQPQKHATLSQQLAGQQQQFAREVARLHAADNPLSLAPRSRETPAAFRRTYFDVPGHRQKDAVQVELIPLRHWYSGATICYYTRYVAQYVRGGNEDGIIPWPVCYPSNADRIANPPYVHDIPVPLPPSDYVLPAGTYLTPLLARIYAGREKP